MFFAAPCQWDPRLRLSTRREDEVGSLVVLHPANLGRTMRSLCARLGAGARLSGVLWSQLLQSQGDLAAAPRSACRVCTGFAFPACRGLSRALLR